jgi:hypothetical protein
MVNWMNIVRTADGGSGNPLTHPPAAELAAPDWQQTWEVLLTSAGWSEEEEKKKFDSCQSAYILYFLMAELRRRSARTT